MKPGNLFESGANIGSKSKLNDERENDIRKFACTLLNCSGGYIFLCHNIIRRL